MNLGRRRRPGPEETERKRPGLARGGDQTVARGERAAIRVDVQREVRGSSRDSKLGFSRTPAATQSKTVTVFRPEESQEPPRSALSNGRRACYPWEPISRRMRQ